MIVLPALAILAIVIVALFFVVGLVSMWIPQLFTMIAVGALVAIGWISKDAVLYQSKKLRLTGGLLFGIIASIVLISLVLNINVLSFQSSIYSFAGCTGAECGLDIVVEPGMGEVLKTVNPISFSNILIVMGGTFAMVLGYNMLFAKKKIFK